MRWKIFYGDGSTYDSEQGGPELAPARDVQVIINEDSEYLWATQTSSDYYVWDNRTGELRWWGVDKFGLYDYLIEPGWKIVLFGRTISNEEYAAIFQRAKNDPEWGKKASFRRRERRP
jgi:hypothetical protein